MKLFHVSYDPIPCFTLRVPAHRLPDEDGKMPRIDSIERCVNAKPGQATALYLAKKFWLKVPLYVYEFDTDDIPAGALLEPQELSQLNKVADAERNHEYWLLTVGVPYQEIRYEVIGGGFLPPDPDELEFCPVALRLKLTKEESEETHRLEQIVREFNSIGSDGSFMTADAVISDCIEEIAETLLQLRENEGA